MRLSIYILGAAMAVVGMGLALGVYISPKDELKKSDVIIAVSGGDTNARALEAVALYQEGWAPRIIYSGAAEDPESESNAAAMRNIAIEAGVSPDAITVEERSDNTRENAVRSAALVEALEYNSVILVTSPYHQRRSYIEFKAQLRNDVQIINHPAVDQRWSRSNWWRTPFGWRITLSEVPKVIYALSQS